MQLVVIHAVDGSRGYKQIEVIMKEMPVYELVRSSQMDPVALSAIPTSVTL